jgi:hypothetical protein
VQGAVPQPQPTTERVIFQVASDGKVFAVLFFLLTMIKKQFHQKKEKKKLAINFFFDLVSIFSFRLKKLAYHTDFIQD